MVLRNFLAVATIAFPLSFRSEISPIVDSKIAAERAPMPLMLIRFLKPSRVSAKDVIFFKFLEAMWPMSQIIFAATHFIGTTFILTYFDDVKLRQRIEKQLNKVELSNKFSKAVFFANNQEFREGTKEEQEIVTACKVLIQNIIVL